MKKIISIILVIVFCMLFSMVGCNKKTEFDFTDEDDDVVNFYGTTFTLMSEWAYEFKDKKGYTTTADRQLKRYEDIESAHNCHIEIVHTGSTGELMLSGGLTGRSVTDLADLMGIDGYIIYQAGFLYSMDDIPTIDTQDEKWGPAAFRLSGNFDGVDYGFLNYYWENVPQFGGALFYNTKVGEDLGLSDPHEYVENDEWTWKNFSEQLSLATCTLDEISYHGMEYLMPETLCQAAIYSNGGTVVKQLNNGTYQSGLNSSETIEALEFVAEINQKGYLGGSFEDYTAAFYNGESQSATLNFSQTTSSFAVTMEKFGVLRFPYGPSGNSDSVGAYTYYARRLFFFSAITSNTTDDIGLFTDMLFEPLPDSPDDGWRTIAGEQMFHYDQDFENFVYSVENCNYDYSIPLYSVHSDLVRVYNAVINGSMTATTAVSSIEKEFSDAIDNNLNR